MKKLFLIFLCLSALILVTDCGISKRALADAEKRIDALLKKGVPDSSLSRAKVFLYQARDAKKRGNRGLANESADSMRILIAKAEEQYAKDMKRLQPYLAQLKGKFKRVRADLTGLQRARLDSMVHIIDSLIAMKWLIPAEAEAKKLDTLLPRLKFNQKRAEEIRSRIPGKWICTQVTKHSEDKTVHAVEKKIFNFRSNGKGTFVQKKMGKSSPTLKEDWEFKSWGTWDLLGDTVFLFVDRFAAIRQNFEEYHKTDGKVWWKKKSHPTYDSAITDGSQDRWITFSDLKKDFKHIR